MKRIAYLRVSTPDQCVDRQIDGLKQIADKLHVEKVSAVSKTRPVYETVIAELTPGDLFIIWDLDRAYRSAKDALTELDRLRARGIELHIANLGIDTSTPYGKLFFTFVSGLAEFERDLLSQRTKEGLAAARRRGKQLGRPRKLSPKQVETAHRRVIFGKEPIAHVAEDYGVAAWTLSRAFKRDSPPLPTE